MGLKQTLLSDNQTCALCKCLDWQCIKYKWKFQKIVPAMKWLSVIFLHSQCCFIVNSFFKTADFFNLSKFFAPSSLQKCLAHWFDLCQDSELYFYSKCQIYKFCVLIHRYFHLSVLNVTFLYFKTLKTLLFLGKKRKKKRKTTNSHILTHMITDIGEVDTKFHEDVWPSLTLFKNINLISTYLGSK